MFTLLDEKNASNDRAGAILNPNYQSQNFDRAQGIHPDSTLG